MQLAGQAVALGAGGGLFDLLAQLIIADGQGNLIAKGDSQVDLLLGKVPGLSVV